MTWHVALQVMLMMQTLRIVLAGYQCVTWGAVGVRYLHPPHEVLGSDDVALPHC